MPLLYTVTVSNRGPNTARNTLLTIALSDSQMIQNVLATIGTPLTSSNAVTLDAGELAVGASATLTVQVSAAAIGDQIAIRLVFPRRAGLAPRPYEYVISSDLTQWVPALNVSETVLATQTVDGIPIETVETLIPTSNPVSGFVRFKWSPH